MRSLMVATVAAGTLLGCTGAAVQPVATSTAGVSCISLTQVAGRRAVADGVLFELVGRTNYLNRLRGECPFLARLGSTATISVAGGGEGGQLCSGDRVRIFDPVEVAGRTIAGVPTCVLSEFVPVPRTAAGPGVSRP